MNEVQYFEEEERRAEEKCFNHSGFKSEEEFEAFCKANGIDECTQMSCWDGCPFRRKKD